MTLPGWEKAWDDCLRPLLKELFVRPYLRLIMIGLLWIGASMGVALAQEATPEANPGENDAQQDEIEILVNTRMDLELLASTLNAERPIGWTGSLDTDDPQLPIYIRLDLELLAGGLVGLETRPEGWFGVVSSSAYFIARDTRHDLELLADLVLDPEMGRPEGWIGAAPILRCDRATQALVDLLELNEIFVLEADAQAPDFCAQAMTQASVFVELNYLERAPVRGILTDGGLIDVASVNTRFAVGFIDRAARTRAGVIPEGTPIQPVARSYALYSSMMLVRGDGFELFVDYQFTSVSANEFDALPDVDEIQVETYCQLEWCEVAG